MKYFSVWFNSAAVIERVSDKFQKPLVVWFTWTHRSDQGYIPGSNGWLTCSILIVVIFVKESLSPDSFTGCLFIFWEVPSDVRIDNALWTEQLMWASEKRQNKEKGFWKRLFSATNIYIPPYFWLQRFLYTCCTRAQLLVLTWSLSGLSTSGTKANQDTYDLWDIRSEWWWDKTWPTKTKTKTMTMTDILRRDMTEKQKTKKIENKKS